MVGSKPAFTSWSFQKALDHQAGADQEHQRECQFGRDQHGAEALGGRGGAGASGRGFESLVERGGAHVQDGGEAEDACR